MSDANRPDPADHDDSGEIAPSAGGASSAEPEPSMALGEALEHVVDRDGGSTDAPDDSPKVERMDVDPDTGEHLETEVSSDAVTVRRSPRYGSFLLLGAALGVLVALILTFAFPENAQFDRGQVFGFLLLWCGAGGLALGGVVALVIDRVLAKRRGTAVAEHASTHYVEDDPEA
ncbi:hypothetical protein [Agromyces sp. ZXT2-3]|uniref:hypothetical protein n=1 Tax=Agromyces sp. ZXT2-3 TaxID=3461152 RepID=UPI0040553236